MAIKAIEKMEKKFMRFMSMARFKWKTNPNENEEALIL